MPDEPEPQRLPHAQPEPKAWAGPTAGASPSPDLDRPPSGAYIPRPSTASAPAPLWKRLLPVALALAVGAGGWFAVATRGGPPPSGPPPVVQRAERVFPVSGADAAVEATRLAREDLLRGVVPKALEAASPEVRAAVRDGRMQLFQVRLVDFVEEDGDAVEVSIDGQVAGTLMLSHAGGTVTLPLKPGVESTMRVKAVMDGGGGVTLGLESSVGAMKTRVMTVGETEDWTVSFK